jgi:DnaJ-class molecular chaperone
MEDYYKILGIDRNYPFTDASDLKKKYLKLSVKLHPDKNPNNPKAKENFQKLTEAYNVLSDPKKRLIYSSGGIEALNNMNNMDSMDSMDRTKPKIVYCVVSLGECYSDITKKIDVIIKTICKLCYGIGGKKETSIACTKCLAKGFVEEAKEVLHPLFGRKVLMQTREECKVCNGKGIIFKDKCSCNDGFIEITEKVKFKIKKGFINHHQEYPGMGDENKSGVRGMLVIVQKLDENSPYKIHKNNKHIILEKEINVIDALTGVDFMVELPNGKQVNIVESNIISPKSSHIVENAGLPINDDLYGDLIITYDIKYPKKLNNQDIKKLSELSELSELYKKSNKSNKLNKSNKNEYNIIFTNKNIHSLIEHDKRKKQRNIKNYNHSDTDSDSHNDSDSDSDDNNDEKFVFNIGNHGNGEHSNGGINLNQLFSGFFGGL